MNENPNIIDSMIRIGDCTPDNIFSNTEPIQSGNLMCDDYYVVGASVKGKYHKSNNTERDDAFSVAFNSPWLVVSVSDGAGSKVNSRYGALFCANTLCNNIQELLLNNNNDAAYHDIILENDTNKRTLEKLLLDSFLLTRKALEKFAQKNTLSLNELHCTLLAFVLNVRTNQFVTAQVGDGLLLGLINSQKATVLNEPKIPDDPSMTYFFTQEEWEDYYVSTAYSEKTRDQYSTFYVMTDGVANDCQYEPPIGVLDKWAKDIDREIRSEDNLQIVENELKTYLENYKAPGSYDDRTLVVICRKTLVDGITNE